LWVLWWVKGGWIGGVVRIGKVEAGLEVDGAGVEGAEAVKDREERLQGI